MKFIVGKKLNMSQNFKADGAVVPVTAIVAEPMTVTQVKSKATDGYDAIQVGYGLTKESKINKAQKGHAKGLGNFGHYKEFRVADVSTYKVGDRITVANFELGEKVRVSGKSKGKGFQGGVKRHGFKGGSRTHGQKHSEREPGAIGGGGRAGGRVVKGMRMAGRMGSDRITIDNLHIEAVLPDQNVLLLSGAVPGTRGSSLEIIGK
ncbi:MAG: 50S ribosomal protein L3 [Candidatus Taylorbacteria bacterium]|nr:50S ribosomal protein L3 [Candidatus Taylorbacteria bacterium]